MEAYPKRNHTISHAKRAILTNTTSTATTSKIIPKLTNDEHDYLCSNVSCFKYRKPNVTHTSVDCLNDFSNLASYKPLVISRKTKSTKKATKVVAVIDDIANDDNQRPSSLLAVCFAVLSPESDTVPSDSESDKGYIRLSLTSPHLL